MLKPLVDKHQILKKTFLIYCLFVIMLVLLLHNHFDAVFVQSFCDCKIIQKWFSTFFSSYHFLDGKIKFEMLIELNEL